MRVFILSVICMLFILGCGREITDNPPLPAPDGEEDIYDGADGPEFCGISTEYACESNDDCMTGGCSGQVCQGVEEEKIMTTCQFRECYSGEKYGLTCGCFENKCIWG